MSWDHTVTFSSSGTWTFPSRGVRESKLFVAGCGKGGNGGNHYQETYPIYNWVDRWVYPPDGGHPHIETTFELVGWGSYTNGGGGGEAGEYKEQTITISDTSPITVTISSSVYFGVSFSCAGGANGGNAGNYTNYGVGGSGGPGADGASGSRSSGGQGGYSGVSGYGSGGTGGFNGGPGSGQGGFISVSWNDGGYAYVMEGE